MNNAHAPNSAMPSNWWLIRDDRGERSSYIPVDNITAITITGDSGETTTLMVYLADLDPVLLWFDNRTRAESAMSALAEARNAALDDRQRRKQADRDATEAAAAK